MRSGGSSTAGVSTSGSSRGPRCESNSTAVVCVDEDATSSSLQILNPTQDLYAALRKNADLLQDPASFQHWAEIFEAAINLANVKMRAEDEDRLPGWSVGKIVVEYILNLFLPPHS